MFFVHEVEKEVYKLYSNKNGVIKLFLQGTGNINAGKKCCHKTRNEEVLIMDLPVMLFMYWTTVFVGLCKGIKSTRKVFYYTASFLYLILITFVIYDYILSGARTEIKYLFRPVWDKFLEIKQNGSTAVKDMTLSEHDFNGQQIHNSCILKKKIKVLEISDVCCQYDLIHARLLLVQQNQSVHNLAKSPLSASEYVTLFIKMRFFNIAIELPLSFSLPLAPVSDGLTYRCIITVLHPFNPWLKDEKKICFEFLAQNDSSNLPVMGYISAKEQVWYLLKHYLNQHEKGGPTKFHRCISSKLLFLYIHLHVWSMHSHQDYIAKFGHGSAKLAKQAQSREKAVSKMIVGDLVERIIAHKVIQFYFPDYGTIPPAIMVQNVLFCYKEDEVTKNVTAKVIMLKKGEIFNSFDKFGMKFPQYCKFKKERFEIHNCSRKYKELEWEKKLMYNDVVYKCSQRPNKVNANTFSQSRCLESLQYTVRLRRPLEKELLDQELKFIGDYGLRNKHEVWRVKYIIAKICEAARELLTLDEKDNRWLFKETT